MRLVDAGQPWVDRNHFIGIAARSMRQILVDGARARGAQKRWAGMDRVSLTDTLAAATQEDAMLPALDEALTRLEALDPEQARIVELRYFVGLSIEESASRAGHVACHAEAAVGARARLAPTRVERLMLPRRTNAGSVSRSCSSAPSSRSLPISMSGSTSRARLTSRFALKCCHYSSITARLDRFSSIRSPTVCQT